MDRTANEIVVALISRKGEVIQIRQSAWGIPVVVSQGWKKTVVVSARPIAATVRPDIGMVKLPYISIDGGRCPIRIIIVTGRDDKINLPTVDQGGYIRRRITTGAIIPDDREGDRWIRSSCWGRLGGTG